MSLPLFTRLIFHNLKNSSNLDYNVLLLVSSFVICTVTCVRLDIYSQLERKNQLRTHGLMLMFQLITIANVVIISYFIAVVDVTGRGVAVLYIISILYFFLAEMFIFTIEAAISDESEQPQVITVIGTKAYLAAMKWLAGPLVTGFIIALLTFLISEYENSLANHATIFGLYLAIAIVFKEKRQSLRSDQGMSSNPSTPTK